MKRVRFSRNVTVYEVDNYDRTSPWEITARDRVRFKHRIKMTLVGRCITVATDACVAATRADASDGNASAD